MFSSILPNRRFSPAKFFCKPFLKVVCLLIATAFVFASTGLLAHAQHTLEIEGGVGVWLPFLPDYHSGSVYDPVAAEPTWEHSNFDSSDDATGIIFSLAAEQQLGSCLRFRMSGFYATAEMRNTKSRMGDDEVFGDDAIFAFDLNGADGVQVDVAEEIEFELSSEIQHYGTDMMLFREYPKRRGSLSFGAGFSYMGFTQDFTMRNQTPQFTSMFYETIQSNYYGGKLTTMWEDRHHRYPINLDFSVGLYGLDASYRGRNDVRNGGIYGAMLRQPTASDNLTAFATTIEGHIATECSCSIFTLRPRVGFKYLSDLPVVQHPMMPSAPATHLTTADAFFLTFDLQVLLY